MSPCGLQAISLGVSSPVPLFRWQRAFYSKKEKHCGKSIYLNVPYLPTSVQSTSNHGIEPSKAPKYSITSRKIELNN